MQINICNNKQHWNKDKCSCEYKELINKGRCDKGFIWKSSNCECDKLGDIVQYSYYRNFKRRKKLIDKLVEECNENIDGNVMIHNDYRNVCNSCTICTILFAIAFLIIIGISSAYFYFHWYFKKDITCFEFSAKAQTTIY